MSRYPDRLARADLVMARLNRYRPTNWSEAEVRMAAMLWNDGHSASITARKINHKFGMSRSRCSIIGLINRLGFPKRQTKFNRHVKRRPKSNPKLQVSRRRHKSRALLPAPEMRPCNILELNNNRCRFPIGDPGNKGFHFCGADTYGEPPYCQFHSRIAHYRTINLEQAA